MQQHTHFCYCPKQAAVICGMEKIKSESLAKKYNSKLGEWLYTIEFEDGSSIEVPECYLEPYEKGKDQS
ncbi:MAG: hypothetical protein K1060chlam4_00636 [Candidatus Anoxychlamydiales bacterium]|nr:hypothetical protein [Candidatus Anoxychlamydiales bacterium]